MRNLSVALFTIAWLSLGQQSQPPSPAPNVIGKTGEQEKADKNAVPKALAQPPVVVNVHVPKSDLNVADWFLVIFTGGLVGVGYWQWKTLQAHHDVMKISAEAAKSSAATLALQREVMDTQAGYIGNMLAQINKSADAAEKSVRIAERTLMISQQALVVLDAIRMNEGVGAMRTGPDRFLTFLESKIDVTLSNVGPTIAEDFYYTIWVDSGFSGNESERIVSRRTILQPRHSVKETTLPLQHIIPTEALAGAYQNGSISVNGIVRYKTIFSKEGTRLDFCGRWDKQTKDFRISSSFGEDSDKPFSLA